MHRRSHGPVEALQSAPDVAPSRPDEGAKSVVPHYYGVSKLGRRNRSKPYQAQYYAGGKRKYLGIFATAEEAALKVASLPKALISNRNSTGYYGVSLRTDAHRTNKPFQASVHHGGFMTYLGSFATPEEAALCVASSAEGRDYVERAAAKSLLALEGKKKQAPKVVWESESEPKPTVNRRSCWTEEEEARLQAAIAEIGVDKFLLGSRESKWEAVSKIVGTRSVRQCARRWHANQYGTMLRTSGRLKRRLEFTPQSPERKQKQPPKLQRKHPEPLLPVQEEEDKEENKEEQGEAELEQLADLFDTDAEASSEAPAPFDVPQFKLSPGEEKIYDHYGLLAIESLYDEADTTTTTAPTKPVFNHVVGRPLKSSFQFAPPRRMVKTKRNMRLRAEAAIREHQAGITDYMLKVYCWQ